MLNILNHIDRHSTEAVPVKIFTLYLINKHCSGNLFCITVWKDNLSMDFMNIENWIQNPTCSFHDEKGLHHRQRFLCMKNHQRSKYPKECPSHGSQFSATSPVICMTVCSSVCSCPLWHTVLKRANLSPAPYGVRTRKNLGQACIGTLCHTTDLRTSGMIWD